MTRSRRPDELQERMRRAANRRTGPEQRPKRTSPGRPPKAGGAQTPKRASPGGQRRAGSGPRPGRATDVALSADAYDVLRDFAAEAGIEIQAVAEALADQLDEDPGLAERIRLAVSGAEDDAAAPRDVAHRHPRVPLPAASRTWTRLPVIGIPVFTPALLPLKWSMRLLRAWLPTQPPPD